MKKIKILFVNGGLMDRGGISMFIINYLKYFDFSKFEVNVAVHGYNDGSNDNEIKKMGCKIFNLPIKSKNYIKWKKELTTLLVAGDYDLIHSNVDAGNGPILKIAKKCGVPIRISHAHNTQFLTNNKLRIIINNIEKNQIKKYATSLFACSNKAGEWLYGNYNFTVINNAIDYNKFIFDETKRKKIRKLLNISNEKFLIGHVGRFDYQKNHDFILKLAEIFNKDSNIIFLLIGDGHLKNKVENVINKRRLNNVMLTGEIENVSDYLNAMDCFILPSLFEGLSVVSIEAQVNGLQCLFSDTITKECVISNNVSFLSINNTHEWEKALLNCLTNKFQRHVNLYDDFNLEIQSKLLQKKYINLLEE